MACVILRFSPLWFEQCIGGYRAKDAVEMLKAFYRQENPNGRFHVSGSILIPQCNFRQCWHSCFVIHFWCFLPVSFCSTKIKSTEKGQSEVVLRWQELEVHQNTIREVFFGVFLSQNVQSNKTVLNVFCEAFLLIRCWLFLHLYVCLWFSVILHSQTEE